MNVNFDSHAMDEYIIMQLDPANSKPLIRIPRYFEIKTISHRFTLQSFVIGHFDLLLFQKCFPFPLSSIEIAGFNCTINSVVLVKLPYPFSEQRAIR